MILNPHGSVIFCDDIRQEANGKLIFIGVYRDTMYFKGPPPWQLMSGLRCHVFYRERKEETLPELRFEIRMLTKSKGETVDAAISPELGEDTPQAGQEFDFEKNNFRLLQFTFTAEMKPLLIEEDTKITVVAVRNDEELLLDRLRITQHIEKAEE